MAILTRDTENNNESEESKERNSATPSISVEPNVIEHEQQQQQQISITVPSSLPPPTIVVDVDAANLQTPNDVLNALGKKGRKNALDFKHIFKKFIGPRNPYLLLIWIMMGVQWATYAQAIMVSSFYMESSCEGIDVNATYDECGRGAEQKNHCKQQREHGTLTMTREVRVIIL